MERVVGMLLHQAQQLLVTLLPHLLGHNSDIAPRDRDGQNVLCLDILVINMFKTCFQPIIIVGLPLNIFINILVCEQKS